MSFQYQSGVNDTADPHTAYQLAAIARPGDTVLLTFNRPLDDAEIADLEASFAPLKDRGVEVHFTDQVSGMVVIRPDEDDIDDWGGE